MLKYNISLSAAVHKKLPIYFMFHMTHIHCGIDALIHAPQKAHVQTAFLSFHIFSECNMLSFNMSLLTGVHHRARWCSNKTLGLYSGRVQFESQSGNEQLIIKTWHLFDASISVSLCLPISLILTDMTNHKCNYMAFAIWTMFRNLDLRITKYTPSMLTVLFDDVIIKR
jgi:hypothetical protein